MLAMHDDMISIDDGNRKGRNNIEGQALVRQSTPLV